MMVPCKPPQPRGLVGFWMRELLTDERVEGTIVKWKGNMAWVKPFEPINDVGRPYIYMSARDIEEELDDSDPTISFVIYKDSNGFGAQEVRRGGGASRLLPFGLTWRIASDLLLLMHTGARVMVSHHIAASMHALPLRHHASEAACI